MSERRRRFRFLPHGKGSAKVLGAREAEIIEYLWRRSPATVSEVHLELSRQRQIAYTTVMTIMSRMAQKGLLARELSGNAYVYVPAITREEFDREVARSVLDGLLEGFTPSVLSYFVERLAAEDDKALAELERLIRLTRIGKGEP